MSVSAIPPFGPGTLDISSDVGYYDGFNLDVWIMALQMGRIDEVENAIKMQMDVVENRNKQIEALNDLQQLVTEYEATFPTQADTGAKGSDLLFQMSADTPPKAQYKIGGGAWVDGPPTAVGTKASGGTIDEADLKKYAALAKASELGVTIDLKDKGATSATLQGLKRQVDSLSNQTQMDLTRLQSLNNKRTEGFDFLTNWLKKMNDTHSSIIRNI